MTSLRPRRRAKRSSHRPTRELMWNISLTVELSFCFAGISAVSLIFLFVVFQDTNI